MKCGKVDLGWSGSGAQLTTYPANACYISSVIFELYEDVKHLMHEVERSVDTNPMAELPHVAPR